ncbi:uncharacterized protein A1O9_08077 [Exophiala aquamarina CBS 119918]|uniref:Uncharacterized protein n=1 Tax=Exophiala aquamarina CBS 119918 TaxID=1182545 RepID=A0A072P9E9_9EURO|nr:uncharacterized protein A1O9_08077 [Exophiala aquamarina CBS 119918]KEF56496.1 hypothetical protein A1O9_08077 [Exophiala aquamarina CBS 119918]
MPSESQTFLLVPSSNFSQQGTIDWVSLEAQVLSFSFGILGRLSSANVDGLTISVGQILCQRFCLGPTGRSNVQEALAKLRSYSGFGDSLWFGFGIRSLVRTMGNSQEGTALLALCGAMGECFPTNLGAEVLLEMTQLYDLPGHLTPSGLQWSALIKACAGVFAATPFPVLAEQFMTLGPSKTRFTTYVMDIQAVTTGRSFPFPKDLAAALTGMFKVSCKEISSILIRGGPACGWLAAVAFWLLDLSVTISCEGQLLYSNISTQSDAQIQLIFDSDIDANPLDMQLVTNTYYLRNSAEFLHRESDDLQMTTMSGRLRWGNCLSEAFGADFLRLMKNPKLVGTAIGCAARIFKAFACGDPSIDREILGEWRSHFDSASGLGFVGNTLAWFPELEVTKENMEFGVRLSLIDAQIRYEQQIVLIEEICKCAECFHGGPTEDEALCLSVIFESIVVMSTAMAGISIADGILPSRAGFELFYVRQRRLRTDADEDFLEKVKRIGYIHRVLETTTRNINSDISIAETRLLDATKLFTGQETFGLGHILDITAVSTGGLCLYLDMLRELSLDRNLVGRVHVVPGKIERNGKPFDFVSDREYHPNGHYTGLTDEVPDFTEISMLAQEHVRSLRVSYKLEDKKGAAVHIDPGKLADEACLAQGLVYCRNRQCKEVISFAHSAEKVECVSVHGKAVTVARGDERFRCVLLSLETNQRLESTAHCVLRMNECLQCCFRAAVGIDDGRPVLIIS